MIREMPRNARDIELHVSGFTWGDAVKLFGRGRKKPPRLGTFAEGLSPDTYRDYEFASSCQVTIGK